MSIHRRCNISSRSTLNKQLKEEILGSIDFWSEKLPTYSLSPIVTSFSYSLCSIGNRCFLNTSPHWKKGIFAYLSFLWTVTEAIVNEKNCESKTLWQIFNLLKRFSDGRSKDGRGEDQYDGMSFLRDNCGDIIFLVYEAFWHYLDHVQLKSKSPSVCKIQ